MKTTKPVFIIGSGRSGTLALAHAFAQPGEVEVHHEYLFENILSDAVLYFMGRITEDAIVRKLSETHLAAVYYSKKPVWIDCSNALSWIVKPLRLLFPEAKFVLVIRNGKRVVSSFYHKFGEVMYADESVSVLRDWLESRSSLKPSPEKKYWRPIPLENDAAYQVFLGMNQFERLCYYWTTINLHADTMLRAIDPSQGMIIKFEDLKSPENFAKLTDFIGVEYMTTMSDIMVRPINVHIPKSFPLTIEQEASFERLCGDVMEYFGYEKGADYTVEYHPKV